eukprot:SAG11_NODE_3662_length_2301_cov_3.291099_2_plen_79_part_00
MAEEAAVREVLKGTSFWTSKNEYVLVRDMTAFVRANGATLSQYEGHKTKMSGAELWKFLNSVLPLPQQEWVESSANVE